MTQDDILTIAEKHSSMVAGWCFNAPGVEKFWREAYKAGQKYERRACAKLAMKGTGEAVQTNTLEILQAERQRIAAAIQARGKR
jgi:hypothetical protein